MELRQLEVGLMTESQEGLDWPGWLALAGTAERLGFDGFYTSDHYLSEVPGSGLGSFDAWGALCAVAASTSRIRLGTMVSPVTFRHPSVIAKLAVTADHISGGRIDLAMGTGWYEPEHHVYGFPFPAQRVRTEMLAEQAEIVRRSWEPGEFSFEGGHYSISKLDAQPKPLGDSSPRLIIGGSGGRRSLAIAAAWADEYNTPMPPLEEVGARRSAFEEALEQAGRDRAKARFSVMAGVVVRADASAAKADAESRGSSDGWLVGTPAEVSERMIELATAGVDRIVLEPPRPDDEETIELLGSEVLPEVRGSR